MDARALPVVFIMGPTAAGKTELVLALAEHLPIDVISVDSAQVFRDMDIGTAKPDAATLDAVPHALIDIVDPVDVYSAASFVNDALPLIGAARAAGRLPVLVGGTGLYFRALEQGLSPLPQKDAALRAELEQHLAAEGLAALHAELEQLDPVAAARIHANDSQRILRALEVFQLTGMPISELQARGKTATGIGEVLKFVVAPPDRAELHQRIAQRFAAMMAAGLLAELRGIIERWPVRPDMPAMRCVGYRQLWPVLEGEQSVAEGTERGIIATRQFAKRQYTWLRTEQNTIWLKPSIADRREMVLKMLKSSLK